VACDDEVIPLQEGLETVGDEADLEEVYDTERYLLYVACTRARDHLVLSGLDPTSEFLALKGLKPVTAAAFCPNLIRSSVIVLPEDMRSPN